MDAWFDRLSGSLSSRQAMDVDYDVYAEGEALLGWLNATCRLSAADPFDGNRFLKLLASRIQEELVASGIEIAHFKIRCRPTTAATWRC